MKLRIKKVKLPKTMAYPLKSSFLEQIVLASKFDIENIEHVDYFPKKSHENLFAAHYKGKNDRYFASPGTINIDINAVPLNELKQIAIDLISKIATDFTLWLNKLEENRYDLRDRSHGFHIWIRNNQVVVDQGL